MIKGEIAMLDQLDSLGKTTRYLTDLANNSSISSAETLSVPSDFGWVLTGSTSME